MSDQRFIHPQNRSQSDAAATMSRGESDAFLKAIVTEVISNPVDYFSRKVKIDDVEQDYTVLELETGLVTNETIDSSFSNGEMAPYVVQNTVAVKFVQSFTSTKSSGKSKLCFPFFPQHLSLPVKPGEYVWVYKTKNDEYYWVCRISGVRQVDDANYTHLPRTTTVTAVDKNTKDLNIFYNFEPTAGQGSPPKDFFHNVAKNSTAYKEEFTGETVPRISKGCSDLLIQGSNNSHILLGREKFEEESSIDPMNMTPYTTADDLKTINRKPLSPSIDICVLRKARELFDLKDKIDADKASESVETKVNEGHAGLGSGLSSAIGTRTGNNGLRYFELEKARESLSESLNKEVFTQEFIDSDIYNCIARIYMTNAKTIDDLLFIPSLEGENSSAPQDVLGLGNYGAMVALGANTRLIGTETVKIQNIVGSSGIQFTPQGDVIIHANRDGGAKIVLEATGDIRIIPGDLGIVKIGGEDADTVPMGGLNTTTTPTAPGSITYQPVTTTAAGLLATDPSDLDRQIPPIPGLTSYASKVIIK